jgi:hypothetical protein
MLARNTQINEKVRGAGLPASRFFSEQGREDTAWTIFLSGRQMLPGKMSC